MKNKKSLTKKTSFKSVAELKKHLKKADPETYAHAVKMGWEKMFEDLYKEYSK